MSAIKENTIKDNSATEIKVEKKAKQSVVITQIVEKNLLLKLTDLVDAVKYFAVNISYFQIMVAILIIFKQTKTSYLRIWVEETFKK